MVGKVKKKKIEEKRKSHTHKRRKDIKIERVAWIRGEKWVKRREDVRKWKCVYGMEDDCEIGWTIVVVE